jgi:FKBP-type peptidyl-prolyl cis-trans isomerase FkpA
MKAVAALFIMALFMGCGDGPEQPPARVGAGEKRTGENALITENERIAQREQLDIDSWADRQGLVLDRTGTGVRIQLLRDSSGTPARVGQVARINFTVSLIDGTLCYANPANEPKEFTIEEDNVESGLHEAIQQLSVGDSAVIVLPSHRAHGLIGDQDKIPMRSTVIYHLALVGLR